MKTKKNTSSLIGLGLLFILPICLAGQSTWEKYAGNPVYSGDGSKENYHAYYPSVLFENGTYKMWYTAADKGYTNMHIAYVRSSDGIHWLPSETSIIANMKPASWNRYICNARVIRVRDTLKMWFTAYSELSAPMIGYAWSVNETTWNFYEKPVLWRSENGTFDDLYVFGPAVYHDGTTYHMWYSACSAEYRFNIGYATSADGIHWAKEIADSPVIKTVGSLGWYCHGVHYPTVVVRDGKYHMWFVGSGYDWEKTIGYAFSVDGINWNVENGNINVLEPGPGEAWDNQQVHSPCVIINDGCYKMWYGASNSIEGIWKIGYAVGEGFGRFQPDNPQANAVSLSVSPNPFSDNLTITYDLPERVYVKLELYSHNGQRIAMLEEGVCHSGTYYFQYKPSHLPPGMYLMVLSSPGTVLKQKLIKVH